MRIHCLQHVPFEGPARIADWAARRGHRLAISRLYAGDTLPELDTFDRLIVMGGPMGVADEGRFGWLASEKACIGDAIGAGKSVVGICLGAQLIADVLGAPVFRNAEPEIGWLPIELTEAGRALDLLHGFPQRQTVLHWHGDTFDLPPGALHLARSAACAHQAFLIGERVLGLQFHLESTPQSVADLCVHCADEIVPAAHVQTAAQMRGASAETYAGMHLALEVLLDRLQV
jgi:GMP synthase-like glutamine amidotransferase